MKSITKTAKTPPSKKPCFECEAGIMLPIQEDYHTTVPEYGKLTVPEVLMERCDKCGDTVIGHEGNQKIDDFISKVVNAITPLEIQAFLDKYDLTQKEASEITGYGEKNISRWLRGHMRPSKSVSNFLRTISSNKEAFETLRNENWEQIVSGSDRFCIRQPDTDEKLILKCIDYKAMVDMKLIKSSRSPMEKRTEICKFFDCKDLNELQEKMSSNELGMAAFKDTCQKSNPVSSGIWMELGQRAARHIKVSPYDRDKLDKAVENLRELTQHPLESVIEEVKKILQDAGVALVFVPIMKQSALRGCTQLVSPTKAVIIHGMKYKSVSQFWLILFHEIAHLSLHITEAGQVIKEYQDQSDDSQENEADEWARDTLVYSEKLIEFQTRNPKPKNWQIKQFAAEIKTHPGIVAEVFNQKAGNVVINYGYLKNDGLFPSIDKKLVEKLWNETSLRLILKKCY